jgi:hypothetical protein
MRQRKGATIIINEEPKEVARREQSKEGMMDGWMVWISCARYPQQRRKEKKELVLPSTEREIGLYGTLLQMSRRYFRHSRYLWDAGCATWPLGFPLRLLALALFLFGLHRRQDLQLLRDEVGRIRSGGPGASV